MIRVDPMGIAGHGMMFRCAVGVEEAPEGTGRQASVQASSWGREEPQWAPALFSARLSTAPEAGHLGVAGTESQGFPRNRDRLPVTVLLP